MAVTTLLTLFTRQGPPSPADRIVVPTLLPNFTGAAERRPYPGDTDSDSYPRATGTVAPTTTSMAVTTLLTLFTR